MGTKAVYRCERCGWEGTGAEGCGTHACHPREPWRFEPEPLPLIPRWALLRRDGKDIS